MMTTIAMPIPKARRNAALWVRLATTLALQIHITVVQQAMARQQPLQRLLQSLTVVKDPARPVLHTNARAPSEGDVVTWATPVQAGADASQPQLHQQRSYQSSQAVVQPGSSAVPPLWAEVAATMAQLARIQAPGYIAQVAQPHHQLSEQVPTDRWSAGLRKRTRTQDYQLAPKQA
jgi:hypothetical protein